MTNNFQKYIDQHSEYGVAVEVHHPLVVVEGLPHAQVNEKVIFDTEQTGFVMGMEKNRVEVLLLDQEPVPIRCKVARTGEKISVPVGEALLGRTVNALGELLDSTYTIKHKEIREIEQTPPTIIERSKITKQLVSNIAIVDLLLPLTFGQRSVVIGDRKTGKTSLLMQLVKSQTEQNTVVVFAAVGKRWADLRQMTDYFANQVKKENLVFVASSSHEAPGLIYMAPFTAMTIAEYFRDQGRDVLVILDDLSTHAHFYREFSLLAKRFPGNESYPGDMFYTHARLLERAGNFKTKDGKTASITCLAAAETVDNRVTSTIISNLISMTDGHILFDSRIFNSGRRPAIDYALSVSRVGGKVQTETQRDIRRRIIAILTQYAITSRYTNFGAELGEAAQEIVRQGEQFFALFSQPSDIRVPYSVQIVLSGMLLAGWMKDVLPENIAPAFRDRYSQLYYEKENYRQTFRRIALIPDSKEFEKELEGQKDVLFALSGKA